MSAAARLEAGYLLRLLQMGERLSMPHSRPMPMIGRRCHELRINDSDRTWRIIHRIDHDAIVILEVFGKTFEVDAEDGHQYLQGAAASIRQPGVRYSPAQWKDSSRKQSRARVIRR